MSREKILKCMLMGLLVWLVDEGKVRDLERPSLYSALWIKRLKTAGRGMDQRAKRLQN